jgi:phage baseplate assembly protein gpV
MPPSLFSKPGCAPTLNNPTDSACPCYDGGMKKLFILLAAANLSSGCAVVTVADATVSVAATAVEVTADTVSFAADMVIPDGTDD